MSAVFSRVMVVACLLGVAMGCPPDPGSNPGSGSDVPDAGQTRAFVMASRAESFSVVVSPRRGVDVDALKSRCEEVPVEVSVESDAGGAPRTRTVCTPAAEAVVVPLDVYGIPWFAFTGPDNTPAELPGAWLASVSDTRDAVNALGLPIILALTPLGEAFDGLAAEANQQSGTLVLNDKWKPVCYDPSQDGNPTKWRDAYAGYVKWAVEYFDAQWVYLAQRVNLNERICGSQVYQSILEFAEAAHARLQELEAPPVSVVTVDVEDLYGYPAKPGRCVGVAPADCLQERAVLLDAIVADRLGLVTHPGAALAESELLELPASWLTAVAEHRSDLRAVIADAGLIAIPFGRWEGDFCQPVFETTEWLQVDWVDRVFSAAQSLGSDLVVWSHQLDLMDTAMVSGCPCVGDLTQCTLLESSSDVDRLRQTLLSGLWDSTGEARAAADVWLQLLD